MDLLIHITGLIAFPGTAVVILICWKPQPTR